MSQAFELTVELAGLPPAKGSQAPLSVDHPHIQRTRALLDAIRSSLPTDFKPLARSIGLELTVRTPSPHQAWDATNYLGGVADVLQDKSRFDLVHLGALAAVSVYENDRVIREVRYQHERSDKVGYRLRIWALDRPELEVVIPVPPRSVPVEPRPASSPELCINFVNTLIPPGAERLGTYPDLLLWGADQGIVTPEILGQLQLRAAVSATEAETVMVECRRFREAVRNVLLPEPTAQQIDLVSAVLRRYLPQRSLRLIDRRAEWFWPDRIDLERVLWPVAQSVLALVTSKRRERVRECVSCKQLFVDTSRNNRRRWCDMKSCGNRAKVQAFRFRRHNLTGSGGEGSGRPRESSDQAGDVARDSAGMMRSP